MSRLSRISLLPLACLARPALAQPSPPETITVTATGTPLPIGETGQAISIIDGAELAQWQTPDIAAALTRLPSVSFERNGGLGATTSIFVRGANSEQLLVLIDGVRAQDQAAPAGGYDFGGLLSGALGGGIGRIELLRGANSVAWGSDAIGGVLAITSREVNGAETSLDYGTYRTWNAEAIAGVQRGGYGMTLAGGYLTTDGIPTGVGDTLPNAFGQWHINGKAHLDLAEGLQLTAAGRYAASKVGVDSYGPAPAYALGHYGDWQTSKQGSGRVGLAYASGVVALNAGVAEADTRRAYIDPPSGTLAPYEQTDGRSVREDLTGHVALPNHVSLDFGADHERTSFGQVYFGAPESAHADLASGHALLGFHNRRLDLTGGARVDHHRAFGTHWTFGANGALRLAGDVRLKASYGEGFKAPALFQLYDPTYGTAILRPETSRSYDVGLEKGDRNGRWHAAATWFERTTGNLIDFVSCPFAPPYTGQCVSQPAGYYDNIGRAHAEGIELEGDARPIAALQLRGQYSWVRSIDETPGDGTTGKDLARRPRSLLTASVDWAEQRVSLGGDVRIVGRSFEYSFAGAPARLAPYALVSLRGGITLGRHLEAYGRIENLGDERYQTALGYNSYGRTATIGVRAKL